MSFSKYVSLMLLVPLASFAEDAALEEILEKSRDIHKSSEEYATTKDLPSDEINESIPEDREWMKGRTLDEVPSDSPSETQQQRAWNALMSEAGGTRDSAVTRMGEGPPRPPIPENIMYVYISLSMPEETIRALFHQALETPDLRSVVFVLRGWKTEGLNETVAQLNELFPEAQKLRELPNVQIDPNLYVQQDIRRVPTFSTKDANGQWGQVVGSTSIKDAVKRIESNRPSKDPVGITFDIDEPNLLEIISERIAAHDWKKDVERVKSNILTKSTTGTSLPAATQDDSYLVDLTIVNNRDLRGAGGEIFAPAGVTVNPFDYIATQRRYIFFDANDQKQRAQAKEWRESHDYTTLITTIPLRSMEAREAALREFRQPIYEINQMIIQRFRLDAVPAIAYQEGRMLRVEVAAVRQAVAANGRGNN